MLNNDKNINEVLENISKSKPYGICNLCCQRVSYGYQFLFDNGINCKMYCACTEKYHNFEIDDFYNDKYCKITECSYVPQKDEKFLFTKFNSITELFNYVKEKFENNKKYKNQLLQRIKKENTYKTEYKEMWIDKINK